MNKKPPKPYPQYPLFAHASGKWAKKIGGKIYYFGRWDDPTAALSEYEAHLATQVTPPPPRVARLVDLCNGFLTSKDRQRRNGEIVQGTWQVYRRTCAELLQFFGKHRPVLQIGPMDFASFKAHLCRSKSLTSVGNEINRTKSVFKWALESGMVATPTLFGPDFKQPSARAVRRQNRGKPKKLFSPEQIGNILDELGLHMRAMVWLGINCAFGPTDCVQLTTSSVAGGWVDFPRPKTEVDRSSPLWPETVEALHASQTRRPDPHGDAVRLFFVNRHGDPFSRSVVSRRFRAAAVLAGIEEGGFYWLRSTFATVASGAKDQVALNHLMGHSDRSMGAVYRQDISPERLSEVSNYVREWFVGKPVFPLSCSATSGKID